MKNQLDYWEHFYSSVAIEDKHDSWLEKYLVPISHFENYPVIDLGCGIGDDALHLTKMGFDVIACDYSKKAVGIVNSRNPIIPTMIFDVAKGLPFSANYAGCIVANLSLHYFSKTTTERILKDIRRVLIPSGLFLCRVNSIYDINYGAMQGKKIQDNYYLVNGVKKRFFDENSIRYFFKDFDVIDIAKFKSGNYGMIKVGWELALSNKIKQSSLAVTSRYIGYLFEDMVCPSGCIAGAGTIVAPNKSRAALKKMMEEAPFEEATDTKYEKRLSELETLDI